MGPCCGPCGVVVAALDGGSCHRLGSACCCQHGSVAGGASSLLALVPIPVSDEWPIWNCCCAGESDCLIETQLCEGTSWLVP